MNGKTCDIVYLGLLFYFFRVIRNKFLKIDMVFFQILEMLVEKKMLMLIIVEFFFFVFQ